MIRNARMSYRHRAFTLVELLVVVAIVTVLVAAMLPSLAKARELAKRTTCAANLRQLYMAAYFYQADNNNILPGLGASNSMLSGYAWNAWDNTTGKGAYSFRNFYSTYLNVANDRITYKGTALSGTYPDYVGSNLRNGRPKNLICPGFIDYGDAAGSSGKRLNYVWYSGSAIADSDATASPNPIVEYGVTLAMLQEAAQKRRNGGGTGVRIAPAGSTAMFGDKIILNSSSNIGNPNDTCHLYNARFAGGNLIPEGGNVVIQDGSVNWYVFTTTKRTADDVFTTPYGGSWGQNQAVPFNSAIINSPASGTNNKGGVDTSDKVMMGAGYMNGYTLAFQ